MPSRGDAGNPVKRVAWAVIAIADLSRGKRSTLLDLRDAEIQPGQDAVIDCFVVFGGVELKVPEHWEVVNEYHDWANLFNHTPEQTIEIERKGLHRYALG